MIVKLTPSGEEALWSWACAKAKDADTLNRQNWLAAAHRQINLTGKELDGAHRIWISGANSANGHLHALVLEPGWFRVLPKPVAKPARVEGLLVL